MKKEALEGVLAKLGWDRLDIEILENRGHLTAIVVAPRFEGMDEGERQELMWAHVQKHLEPHESANIEFIFTYSPTEKARLDRGEQLDELQDE